MILSINGNKDPKDIRNFVDDAFLARDSKALRDYINKISPGIELKFDFEDDGYVEEGVNLPITIKFFWPDA